MESANLAQKIAKPFTTPKISVLILTITLSLILGTVSGYFLANKQTSQASPAVGEIAKSPQQDLRLCRDFAEGTVKVKPSTDPNEYTEGTHLLQRDSGQPVALTSSVVDLSLYEEKRVKIFGETQKALKEGWLMDVCRVEQ